MTSLRYFAGATPKIGGILGQYSKIITKKINYDSFCEKFGTYIMTEFKNGEAVIEVTKNHDFDVISHFQMNNKPGELSTEEKKKAVDVEIHKEEIKAYVKELKILKPNQKIYTA